MTSELIWPLIPDGVSPWRQGLKGQLNHLISLCAVVALASVCLPAYAQMNEWTWMGGTSVENAPGVYGVLGEPASGNIPGARAGSATWTDSNGHFWLFGGSGYAIWSRSPSLNDLWEFDPASGEWSWIAGVNPVSVCVDFEWCGEPGVYGTLGKAAPGNMPGSRTGASTWVDQHGHLWLFGGSGFDGKGESATLNDLWEFDPSVKEWTWRSGSSAGQYIQYIEGYGQPGVYGKLGKPAMGNVPGSRDFAAAWIDATGNLWLFGGQGEDSRGLGGVLNDVWMFDPTTNEWAWMGGSPTVPFSDTGTGGNPGVYGKPGVPAPGNIPGSRSVANAWTDSSGNFWLFGGNAFDSVGQSGTSNDLWKFMPSKNEWTWMGGASVMTCTPHSCGQPGVFGTLGVPSAGNLPGGRGWAANWTDSKGSFWLLGGEGPDVSGNFGVMNDLWVFTPSTNEWSWMGGDAVTSGCTQPPLSTVVDCGGLAGVYGTQGTPAVGNAPGSRLLSMAWTDKSGNLWLFGGDGLDATHLWFGQDGMLNDLWRFEPSTSTLPPAVSPEFSSPSGTYGAGGKVSIANGMATSSIYYTADGSTPTTGSSRYKGPVTVSASETLRALAAAPGYRTSAVTSATYIILKPQTITFPQPPASVNYGVAPITLKATASSGLAVVYIVQGPGAVNGSTLSFTGVGPLFVTATQPGNSVYDPASPVMWKMVVNSTSQTINFPQPPTPVTYGVAPVPLHATASSGLPVSYAVYGPATLNGSTLTVTGAGNVGIHADQGGNNGYMFAPEVQRYITVNKAGLRVTATNLTMKQGTAVPKLTYSMAGFVNGDTQVTATTGAPVLKTTATSQSTPGNYPITVTSYSLASKNYTFTLFNGQLTVTK